MKLGYFEHAPGAVSLTVVRELASDEEDLLRRAVGKLNRFWIDGMPMSILLENRDDLVTQTSELAKRHNMDVRLFEGAQQLERHMLIINRLLMNFLSSARSYIDLTKSRLSHTDAVLAARFVKLCSTEYDTSFSYRLLEAVRNIAQHSGLPLKGFSGARDFGGGDEPVYEFLFDRDELLREPKFKQSLRTELAAQPRTFPASPHITEHADRLWAIQMRIMEETIIECVEATNTVESIMAEIPWNKFPFIGEVQQDWQKANLKLFAVPHRSMEMVKAMHGLIGRINRSLSDGPAAV
jgi:hypothetical protein